MMNRTWQSGLGGIAAGALFAVPLALPVASQVPPEVVTSDGPEFCAHLQWRLTELERNAPRTPPGAAPADEVSRLSDEGNRMCDEGNTRAGIQRLRRALVMLMHSQPSGTQTSGTQTSGTSASPAR
jgi:hypothetical protein